jgi:hypothetical protein
MPMTMNKTRDEMQDDDKALEQMVLVRVMRLNLLVNGVAFGLVGGLTLFAVTLFLVIKGGPVVGPHLGLLGQYLPGYTVTLAGSFIGLAYGLLLGFLFGVFVALVYNGIIRMRGATRQES